MILIVNLLNKGAPEVYLAIPYLRMAMEKPYRNAKHV